MCLAVIDGYIFSGSYDGVIKVIKLVPFINDKTMSAFAKWSHIETFG